MKAKFDVSEVRKLKYEVMASRSHRIEMDADEGWLYISTEIIDDRNRNVEYTCTFPLDGKLLEDIREIITESKIPFWKTGNCRDYSRIDYGISWTLMVSTPEEQFSYDGFDAFPEGFDTLSEGTAAMALSLFDSFRFDLDLLEEVFLITDTDRGYFSLDSGSLVFPVDGRARYREIGAEYLERARDILKKYELRPYDPAEIRPMEHGKCIHLVLKERYGNGISLWWGEDRPAWVNYMVQRLRDLFSAAYTEGRPAIDMRTSRDPDQYSLSDGTKRIFLDILGKIGGSLPIDEDEFVKVWNLIIERKDGLHRNLCIGKAVDSEELDMFSQASKEMDQFRCCRLDIERINQILKE